MRFRPLDRVTSIRAKFGSIIVAAIAITILLMYLLFGYALRNSVRDTQTLKLLPVATAAAHGQRTHAPSDVTLAFVGTGRPARLPAGFDPPQITGPGTHAGIAGGYEYVAVPNAIGPGIVFAIRPAPGEGSFASIAATLGFLRSFWWRFLLAGAFAAVCALIMVRWLARGMTKPLRDMSQAAGMMATGDYSQRVTTSSRDEVGQLATAFNRMSGDLESLEKLRRELVANVSHELKTPISALRAHIENLLDGVEAPDRHTLQVMLQQSERLSRLVEQLLDLSRLESGDVPLDRHEVPLDSLVSEVVSEIDVASSGRGVRLETELPPDLPPVLADRERLHQVLFNLLDNAVRFTPAGGEVRVRAHRVNGHCEVEVTDTGPGIPQEHIPRLFERFYRVDHSRSREDGGTGIGLAIARSVVEAHGGRIWADSKVGEGSVFTFELPVATPAQTGREA